MDGLLLVDKPAGMTSHDVVDAVRRLAGQRDVGHAGTLDPLATGLLVVALGRALRLLEFMELHDKEYEAVVRLGIETDTDDAEGRATSERPVTAGLDEIRAAAVRFVGEIEQVPPAYSAIKSGGQPLHRRARRGEAVAPAPRTVVVRSLDVEGFDGRDVRIRLRCGKGTYVRALARDLGRELGCGGHIAALRRTASGPFRIEDASPLAAPLALRPADEALVDLPAVRLSPEDERRFLHGNATSAPAPAAVVRVYGGRRFLGIGAERGGVVAPRKVIVNPDPT